MEPKRAWTDPFARWGTQHTWLMLTVGVVSLVVGVIGTMQLHVDADLKALLPPDHESVVRLTTLSQRMGAQSDFIVSIESPSRDANIEVGAALAQKMRSMPELRFVQFHRDLSFFEDRALLFLPTRELLDLRRQVIDRIKEETERSLTGDDEPTPAQTTAGRTSAAGTSAAGTSAAGTSAAGTSAGADTDEDILDLDKTALERKYLGGQDAPTEYMEAEGGTIVVIKARPVEPSTNVAFSQALVQKTEALIKGLDVERSHPGMKVVVQGEYAQRAGSTSKMRSDVLAGAGFALGLLLIVIGLYFKRVQAVPLIVLPVIVSTVVTQAVGAWTYGSYNLVTTFIFAIVMGLGIEFGIHTLARYGHERERGLSLADALRTCLASTGDAVTTGGVTTLTVFFLLAIGDFRGFSQFGVMAGLGVLLALVYTFLLFPSLVAAFDKRWSWVKGRSHAGPIEDEVIVAPPSSSRGFGIAVLIVIVSFTFTGLSIWKFDEVPFEYNFSKLDAPPKPKADTGPEKEDYHDAVGRVTTYAPAVALCETKEQCAEVTRTFAAAKKISPRDRARLRGEAAPPPEPVAAPPAANPAEEEDDDPFAKKVDPFAQLEKELAERSVTPEEFALLERLGPERTEEIRFFLQAYLSLYTFVPDDQPTKLAIIADVRERIDNKRAALKAETRKKVDDFHHYLDVTKVIEVKDLPGWVTEQLVDAEGQLGRFIILWNRGAKANYIDSKRLHAAFFDIPVTGGTVPTAANYFVLVDVIDTLKKDGPRIFTASVIAVLVCLIVFFRSFWAALITLLPLMMAITWLAGAYWLYDWKLNMYSIIAFPLLVGMSIDQGVHVYHRWRESPNLPLVMRETGGANVLTTVTTVIGFGGLWFADNLGIRSLGTTASVGTVLGLIGSCATLPALLFVVDRLRARKSGAVAK